ncbi:MAG: hypothetical protein Q8L87_01280 [Anaerolineales bacterium]|nr:hypothetical protein [Anaerolineales bacterium]
MLNPISPGNSGSYIEVKRKVFEKIKSSKLDKQVSALIQNEYEDALKSEGIVLSRGERKHLLTDVVAQLFDEIIKHMKE